MYPWTVSPNEVNNLIEVLRNEAKLSTTVYIGHAADCCFREQIEITQQFTYSLSNMEHHEMCLPGAQVMCAMSFSILRIKKTDSELLCYLQQEQNAHQCTW